MKNNITYYVIINKKDIPVFEYSETKQARFVLSKLLSYFNIVEPDIIISNNGKPYFKDSNIFFNYSHSKNYIACAVSLSELGIDIEEKERTISDAVSKKYLNNIDKYKRLEYWVKKEAYSKLKGIGLSIGLQNINLDNDKNIFLNSNNYLCSIYSNNNKTIFKELFL
jgi:4'-phosphopantetheinyl transferase